MWHGAWQKNRFPYCQVKQLITHFELVTAFQHIKNLILVGMYMIGRATALRQGSLFKNGQVALGIAAGNFYIQHIGIHAF
jgi:hypothetical protein